MHTYIARVVEEVELESRTEGGMIQRLDYLRVGVFRVEDGLEEQVGEYERNYPALFDTFTHFAKEGRDYALYSPDYTTTRILELPTCKDIGGEEHDSRGFCPIGYFVPTYAEFENYFPFDAKGRRRRINNPKPEYFLPDPLNAARKALTPIQFYPFGFVAGTIWADDEFYKIQYLDLSEAEKGIIKRDDRFGSVMIPEKMSLRDVVDMGNYQSDPAAVTKDDIHWHDIYLTIRARFDLRDGKLK